MALKKITLTPLDARVAEVLAAKRGITVDELIVQLLHEEAAIELTSWRAHKDVPGNDAQDSKAVATEEND